MVRGGVSRTRSCFWTRNGRMLRCWTRRAWKEDDAQVGVVLWSQGSGCGAVCAGPAELSWPFTGFVPLALQQPWREDPPVRGGPGCRRVGWLPMSTERPSRIWHPRLPISSLRHCVLFAAFPEVGGVTSV